MDLVLRNRPINRVINNLMIKRFVDCDIGVSDGLFEMRKLDFVNVATNLTN